MYRLWQLWRALTGMVSADDMRVVMALLTPAEQQLFALLPRYDQRHALDVAQVLMREGHHDPILVAAALLHDIGKVSDNGAPLGLVWYGVIVIARRIPPCYRWLARTVEPVRRHAAHEQRSASRAQRAGARPAVVALLDQIAHHADTPAVRILHEADDRC